MIWRALNEAREFDLPDWWIVSGAIYNTVWNHLSGLRPGTGIRDIDLFYFDSDDSWEAEDRFIQLGNRHFSETPPIEIRNQARVHIWYKKHFGHPMPPFVDCADGIRNFACTTHAVGVKLTPEDQIEIFAPYGLEAIFEMRMVPNPIHLNRATHEAKSARAKEVWKGLIIEPWPEVSVVKAHAQQDWEVVLHLIQNAFAYMEGRIEPPSSMHRLTAATLAEKAQREVCFLAHDGREINGCLFCETIDTSLYINKLSVNPEHQGIGIGRALMEEAETHARAEGCQALELETRIELTENQAAFRAMGFEKVGETAHAGFMKPTSIIMRKSL